MASLLFSSGLTGLGASSDEEPDIIEAEEMGPLFKELENSDSDRLIRGGQHGQGKPVKPVKFNFDLTGSKIWKAATFLSPVVVETARGRIH